MKEQKKIMVELSERDAKWVEAALRKKKSEEKFFAEAWKRREEVVADWRRREAIATERAMKTQAEKMEG